MTKEELLDTVLELIEEHSTRFDKVEYLDFLITLRGEIDVKTEAEEIEEDEEEDSVDLDDEDFIHAY